MEDPGITKDGYHQGDLSLEELARDATEHRSKEPLGILVVEEIEMGQRRNSKRRRGDRK